MQRLIQRSVRAPRVKQSLLRQFSTSSILSQQQKKNSALQQNILRDFSPDDASNKDVTNLTFDELKKMGYETRGDIIGKRVSLSPSSMPYSMAFYSLITSLPLVTGSAIFAYTATPSADEAAKTATWISHELLMNYQLNYSALLLVAYAAIHLGLNYGAFHLPPTKSANETSIDKSVAAEQQKQLESERSIIQQSVNAGTNQERTELVAQSLYAPDSAVGWRRILLALYPMGIAFASFSLPALPAGILLMLGHLFTAVMDSWTAFQGLAPRWYPAMRLAGALVIILTLGLSLFFYIFVTALETIDTQTQQLEQSSTGNRSGTTQQTTSAALKPRPGREKLVVVNRPTPTTTSLEDDDEDIDFEAELKKLDKKQ